MCSWCLFTSHSFPALLPRARLCAGSCAHCLCIVAGNEPGSAGMKRVLPPTPEPAPVVLAPGCNVWPGTHWSPWLRTAQGQHSQLANFCFGRHPESCSLQASWIYHSESSNLNLNPLESPRSSATCPDWWWGVKSTSSPHTSVLSPLNHALSTWLSYSFLLWTGTDTEMFSHLGVLVPNHTNSGCVLLLFLISVNQTVVNQV